MHFRYIHMLFVLSASLTSASFVSSQRKSRSPGSIITRRHDSGSSKKVKSTIIIPYRSDHYTTTAIMVLPPKSNSDGSAQSKLPSGTSNPLRESYNDDAFGLIFLSSSLVAHDFFFSATFLFLSAITASIVNLSSSKNVDANSEGKTTDLISTLPAFVAYASLLIKIFSSPNISWLPSARVLLDEFERNVGVELSPDALTMETAVCTISVLWVLYQRLCQKRSFN